MQQYDTAAKVLLETCREDTIRYFPDIQSAKFADLDGHSLRSNFG